MTSNSSARWLRALLTSLLLGGGVLVPEVMAQRKPRDFQEPRKLTDEELAEAKRSKYNLSAYGETMEVKPKPFPWMAVGLGVLALAVATPFALRTFNNTSKEIASNNTFGSRRATEDD